ncbi:hypothetical protein DAEQUDRAFT_243891 [Daedalea quercina L-15889]|uniref:Uncharacterized protein n=1 Tax=Daedalea quercina L-15889 TaxID=1314783 RepID=A0A165QST8_9APHY|nr:hypothetical protein DAEQUDRAFT_243891 [Daedalea quercina L-15889]
MVTSGLHCRPEKPPSIFYAIPRMILILVKRALASNPPYCACVIPKLQLALLISRTRIFSTFSLRRTCWYNTVVLHVALTTYESPKIKNHNALKSSRKMRWAEVTVVIIVFFAPCIIVWVTAYLSGSGIVQSRAVTLLSGIKAVPNALFAASQLSYH